MVLPQFPFRVEVEVLNACNLDCLVCYAKPFNNLIPAFESIEFLIKKTKNEVKPFELILLGGEPFIRKDIVKILELCKEGFAGSLGISTNGTLLERLSPADVSTLKNISDTPIIQVSIDSVDYHINDLLRGKTEKTLKGIGFLDANAIPFNIGIVMSKANLSSFEQTVGHLSKLKHLNILNLEELQPARCMPEQTYNTLHLSPKEMINATEKASDILKSLGRKDIVVHGFSDNKSGHLPTFYENEFTEKDNIIQVLRAGVFVNGDVTPGAIARNVIIGNLYREDWKDIWKRGIDIYKTAKKDNKPHLMVLR